MTSYNQIWGPNGMEFYLKVAVQSYNQYQQGSGSGHPIAVKQLDMMSSELMCDIVTFLIHNIDESQNITKRQETLTGFDKLGLTNGSSTYDATAQYLYHAASKYFREGDDLLHIGVFIDPRRDIKRAKHVIAWLASFVLLIDSACEAFQTQWERLSKENQEKSALYSEIEDIKNNIAVKAIEQQRKEEEKPNLVRELAHTEEILQSAIEKQIKLEEIAKREKHHYDLKASELRALEEALHSLDLKKASLENEIVHSAPEVMNAYDVEQKKLKEELRVRDELGKEIKEIGAREQYTAQLIDRANRTLREFDNILSMMDKAREVISSNSKVNSEYNAKLRELEDVNKSLIQSTEENARLKNELVSKSSQMQDDLEKLIDVYKQTQTELAHLQLQCSECKGNITFKKEKIQKKRQTLNEISENINSCKYYCEVEVPNIMKELENLEPYHLNNIVSELLERARNV